MKSVTNQIRQSSSLLLLLVLIGLTLSACTLTSREIEEAADSMNSIAPGQLSYQVQVQVTYDLIQP